MGAADVIILCTIMLLVGVFLGIFVVVISVFLTFREKKPSKPVQKQKEDPCET